MKDLRIVIVSWNVEKHLERCLASLPGACGGLDWEVVVVDNASHDRSVETAKRHGAEVIENSDNRGFAKACNQGMVGMGARYVLLLNPDTECPKGSLQELVYEADQHPRAGIIGPKLLNADGSTQTSIRRFPTFWTQTGIMLKLHHVFPGAFKKYFAQDLPLEKSQAVDQVMGACFLIRAELLNQIGGLDERYFIWFEEVDYCRQARAAGWDIYYASDVSVTHLGGQSFGQVFSSKKQSYFNQSLIAYIEKWHGGFQAFFLKILNPISMGLAWVAGSIGAGGKGAATVLKRGEKTDLKSDLLKWAAIVVVIELLSALTIFRDTPNAIVCLVVGAVIAWLAFTRPTLALAAVLLELLIGSKGQLLQVWGWPGIFSLRVVMFGAFMLGWFGSWTHARTDLWKIFKTRWEWVVLGGFLVYAVARGFSLGNGPVIADANAWAFALLAIPVLELASRNGDALKRAILPATIVGTVWLAVKTIGLEYLFSHGFKDISPSAYLWVRRSGVGEVTLVTANAFRIFMQSYVFSLATLLFCASYHFTTQGKGSSQIRRIIDVMTFASLVTLAISLSRSMWIGAAVGLLALAGMYWKKFGQVWKGSLRMAMVGGAALVLIFVTLAFPIPRVNVASLGDLFGSRVSTGDAAAVSRWRLFNVVKEKILEQPILGSGFGATVTYKTQDPRILAQNPSGLYTTYAFEWGWLEHWVKFGVFGFLLMILLVVRIGQRVLRSDAESWLRYGAVAALIGLAATHVFTPYLNHPLGLGYLLFLEGMAMVYAPKRIPA